MAAGDTLGFRTHIYVWGPRGTDSDAARAPAGARAGSPGIPPYTWGRQAAREVQAMMQVRPPAVAGQFYPGDPAQLRDAVCHFMATVSPQTPVPKAIIAPHAGYMYSGPIAASAYACLQGPGKDPIRRVVLLGPAHRVYFH